ncbi:glycosyltransferase family 2 protein [Cryobacterium levicorallinum]|uniref:glycosyltransferase family 2 protein n=1 Tax=Cryobacterium levicorallinum TaxID=995038 RepID=UPI00141A6A39|nr:glycosyltransferase family 2 protein [Cryobacterium levicorallinum]
MIDFEELANPLVTVVIPTIGRAELNRAVTSVKAQTLWLQIELVVVVDLAHADFDRNVLDFEESDQLRIIHTKGKQGGGHARNLGVSAGRGNWVAFLDDDDYWLPTKIAEQIAVAKEYSASGSGSDLVISCRSHLMDSRSAQMTARNVPIRLMRRDESIVRYLLIGRRPGAGRASMFTPTLLVNRSLALRVPWEASLRRHQDWDWLIRLENHGATFRQSENALVVVQVGSAQSVSAGQDWQSSLDWGEKRVGPLNRLAYADFLVAQVLRYVLQAKSGAGFVAVVRHLVKNRTWPSFGPVLIGFAGLMPRRAFDVLLGIIR